METPTQAGTPQPAAGPGTPDEPSRFGPPSPLEPLALALELGRPVSRGFALVLVALVLAALGWVDHRQAARLDAVESAVAGTTSSVVQGARATVADPDPCWLLGVIAGAQGKADLVSRLGSTTSSTGDCEMYAERGARGQDLEGS